MQKKWIARGIKIALMALVGCAVFGWVVMSLWNWLMPVMFGWHIISFWQALGLFVLAKILFGGFHGPRGMHSRRHMFERWEQMTPEERDRFRQGIRGRCGHFGSRSDVPVAEQKA
jgi:hypothetical protein